MRMDIAASHQTAAGYSLTPTQTQTRLSPSKFSNGRLEKRLSLDATVHLHHTVNSDVTSIQGGIESGPAFASILSMKGVDNCTQWMFQSSQRTKLNESVLTIQTIQHTYSHLICPTAELRPPQILERKISPSSMRTIIVIRNVKNFYQALYGT